MGRMLKKKPMHLKKKTQDAGDYTPDSIQTEGSSPVAVNSERSGEPKEKKQKPVLSISKHSTGEQTALMKLVDRYFGKWLQFLREVKVELSKVTWPSRKETIGTTAVVIVFVFILSIFLGAVDFSLTSLIRLIL